MSGIGDRNVENEFVQFSTIIVKNSGKNYQIRVEQILGLQIYYEEIIKFSGWVVHFRIKLMYACSE